MISTHFRLPHPALDGPGGCGWDAIVKNSGRSKNLGGTDSGRLGQTGMVSFCFFSILAKSAPSPHTHPAAPDRAIEKNIRDKLDCTVRKGCSLLFKQGSDRVNSNT